MTVRELLDYVDGVYPSQYTDSEKIKWLNEAEEQIFNYLLQFDKDIEWSPYDASSDDELLIDEPGIYALYISSMSDFANGEFARYNNKAILYQAKMDDWKSAYIRANMPIPEGQWINL